VRNALLRLLLLDGFPSIELLGPFAVYGGVKLCDGNLVTEKSGQAANQVSQHMVLK
jgi:hypothetical protein